MKFAFIPAALAALVLAAACNTKHYPMVSPEPEASAAILDCDALRLEVLRVEAVRGQILETAEWDARSIAGFIGGLGIGNAMAKSEADRALSERLHTLHRAQTRAECLAHPVRADDLVR